MDINSTASTPGPDSTGTAGSAQTLARLFEVTPLAALLTSATVPLVAYSEPKN